MRWLVGRSALLLLGTPGCADFVGAGSDTSSAGSSVDMTSTAGEASGSTAADPGTATTATVTTTVSDTMAEVTTADTVDTEAADTTAVTETSSSGDLPASCDNGIRDGDETDIDCGGPCQGCDFGQGCAGGTDCDTGFCAVDFTCGLQTPRVWLDAKDPDTLFSDAACNTSAPTNGQQVHCWTNKGSAGGMFVDEGSQPSYRQDEEGLEFGDDLLASRDPVFGGVLDDVTIFVVQQEISSRNSFDFNLNHPFEMNMSRYSTQIPWGSSRRVNFDIGGTGSQRIQTAADVIEVGETHLFTFVNSADENARMIRIDGTEQASGDGNRSATAGTISIGSGANILVHEFRLYTPSPSETHREVIEGQMACTWSMRDQLPAEHPFHADDADDQTGCPPALE